jgi:hypothetical protein
MQTGQLNEVVTFVVPNGQDFIDQATKKAIEDARKQAEKVAALSNVTLGKIQSISISMGANPAGQKVNYYNPYGFNAQGGKSSKDSRHLSSREFKEIPVVMKAHIKFEIVD